jgi:hypothetical protein
MARIIADEVRAGPNSELGLTLARVTHLIAPEQGDSVDRPSGG